ncbi:hypothetical protein ASG75_15325 [Rhodanobacter sp. Soil772]|nr:hypothetical protein ASG75_15325 [Rhodanobacter sp. Soil772]
MAQTHEFVVRGPEEFELTNRAHELAVYASAAFLDGLAWIGGLPVDHERWKIVSCVREKEMQRLRIDVRFR